MKARVTVVCGAPGSGKTTFVRERIKPNDLIVDYDALMAAISGLSMYERPESLRRYAEMLKGCLIDGLRGRSFTSRAWVITSGARLSERNRLRDELGAEVVVIETPEHVCVQRIANDDTRTNDNATSHGAISKWWGEYRADDRDTVVKAAA